MTFRFHIISCRGVYNLNYLSPCSLFAKSRGFKRLNLRYRAMEKLGWLAESVDLQKPKGKPLFGKIIAFGKKWWIKAD